MWLLSYLLFFLLSNGGRLVCLFDRWFFPPIQIIVKQNPSTYQMYRLISNEATHNWLRLRCVRCPGQQNTQQQQQCDVHWTLSVRLGHSERRLKKEKINDWEPQNGSLSPNWIWADWWMLFKLLTLWVVGCRDAVICHKSLELMVVGVTATDAKRPDRCQRITFGFSFPQNVPDLCRATVDGVLRADFKNAGCLNWFTARQKQKIK